MIQRFVQQTVIVTGAASGIGYEMAARFAADGAKVYAGDVRPAGVPELSTGVVVDVSDDESVAALIARAVDETGRLDVLCNNAGIGSTADPLTCTPEEWDRVFAVNARGPFLGTRHALPTMLAQRRGVIINTASVAGTIGLPDRTAYCASKGAVIALTKQVAVQFASSGIRCNCLCPGTIDSPWVARLLAEADDPVAMRARLIERQPMGRLGLAEEVAQAALYLASDAAAFVTGAEFVIDGGIVAG